MDENPKKKNKPVSDFDALSVPAAPEDDRYILRDTVNVMSILARSPSD